jgi:hypothetical protein
VEELKDPAKRQIKTESKTEIKTEETSLDIDESDYVPASALGGMKILVSGDDEGEHIPRAQREIILKEISAFRKRSNERDRNRVWYDDEDKKDKERDSPSDAGRATRPQGNQDDRRPLRATPTKENIPSGPAADRRRGTRDYHQSVKFRSEADRYDRDEEEDVPDEELERRRLERTKRELEDRFVEVPSS